MPEKQISSPDPTSAEVDANVDFAGLVDALAPTMSDEDREHFKTNEGKQEATPDEAGEVPAEEGEAALEEETPTPVAEEAAVVEEEKKEVPDSVQRRIDKLTAEKYHAIEEAARLKEQLAQAQNRPVQLPVTPDQPLANVHDHAELSRQREMALLVKEWALTNPEGGTYTTTKDGKEEQVMLDVAQVRDLLVKSNRMLDRDIPARKDYLDQLAGNLERARKFYPDFFQDTPNGRAGAQLLAQYPFLRNFADWPLITIDLINGGNMRLAKEKGKVAPVANPVDVTKPKVIGSPRGQSATRTKPIKSISEYAAASKTNEISLSEAADLLEAFIQ